MTDALKGRRGRAVYEELAASARFSDHSTKDGLGMAILDRIAKHITPTLWENIKTINSRISLGQPISQNLTDNYNIYLQSNQDLNRCLYYIRNNID